MLIPIASATSADAGVASVELDSQPAPHCTIGLSSDFCLATWEKGDDSGCISCNDTIHLTKFGNRARISAKLPGLGEPQEFVVNPNNLSIEHPANHVINGTWLGLNETLAPLVLDNVMLESRPYQMGSAPPASGLILFIASPVPISDPAGGSSRSYLSPSVYSWDCSYYFTTDGESWCSYDAVQPDPEGVRVMDRSDDLVGTPAADLTCANLWTPHVPQPYCVATDPVDGEAAHAARTWDDATPDVMVGGSVTDVRVALKPYHEGASSEGDAALARGSMQEAPSDGWGERQGGAPDGHVGTQPTVPTIEKHGGQRTHGPGPLSVKIDHVQVTKPASAAPTWPRVAAAAAIVLGAAALVALFGMYHRTIKKDKALENPNRRSIYEAIRRDPGARAGTLQRQLGLNYGTVLTHLRALERAHLIEGVGEGQRRYFLNGGTFSREQKAAIVAASAPRARMIVDHVARRGEICLSMLARELQLPLSTASVNVDRLEQTGVLVRRLAEDGRQSMLVVSPEWMPRPAEPRSPQNVAGPTV